MNSLAIYENLDIIKIYNKIDVNINCVKTDTRKIGENDCYVGIKGNSNDGNLLYMEAFLKGASIVVLNKYEYKKEDEEYLRRNNKSIILVKDTIKALGDLAKYKRDTCTNTVIAITGSAG